MSNQRTPALSSASWATRLCLSISRSRSSLDSRPFWAIRSFMCARFSSFFFISPCSFASHASLSFITCSVLRSCFLSLLSCSCNTWVSWLCCAVSSSTVFSSFVLCCRRAWTFSVIKMIDFRRHESNIITLKYTSAVGLHTTLRKEQLGQEERITRREQ